MVSQHYVIMTDGENAKLTQMLAPENLRTQLKTENDALKFEYAARDKSTFQMMTVVPMGWKEKHLTRVMLITQDMGEQHLLKRQHIQEMVRVPYEIDGHMVSIGTSCGFALFPDECPDTAQARLLADQRMYENKQKNHALQDHGLQ